jgi:hypothetical protein
MVSMSTKQVRATKEALAERQAQNERTVLEARARGMSFRQIEVQFDIRAPAKIWKEAVLKVENVDFHREHHLRLEEERLDAIQLSLWPAMLRGDVRSAETIIKVLERRAKMLGLDFADATNSRLVEIEAAKVQLLAAAVVAALEATPLSPVQKQAAATRIVEELRQGPRALKETA